MQVEIISIGEELLIGKTLNTNAHWLAQRLTELGLRVRRITTVGDDVDEISEAVRSASEDGTDLILTTGGLGPTHDDKTLSAIGKAVQRPLQINRRALQQIVKRYRKRLGRKFRLTEARLKMAKLPRTGRPLTNPMGTAPGLMISRGRTTVVALPGVPAELKLIFEASVAPWIGRTIGRIAFEDARLKVRGVFESSLSPMIDEVMLAYPAVYVKSHAGLSEPGPSPLIEVHLYSRSRSRALARRNVLGAMDMMIKLLSSEIPNPTSIH